MSLLSPDQWQIVSPYLDQALTLSETDRARWLEAMRAENPVLANQLKELLDEHDAAARKGYLEKTAALPPLSHGLAGQIVGAYRLISLIGQGGMGAVWLAERNDGRFERKAAVKFLSAALVGRGGEERFKREGAILGRFSHPHIAELLDAGVSSAGPYIVLEYVEGEPIDAYCDARKLDVPNRIRLFLDVLSAVAHAHTHLIIHRDIKPSNVLVSNDGQVKLLDFGIAKLLEGEGQQGAATLLTAEVGAALTPAYAAPEQVSAGAVTTATDVYALGVLLYVLLSGQHPAGSNIHSAAELFKAIVEIEPQRASDAMMSADANIVAEQRGSTRERLRRELRGDLDAIVLKALDKETGKRYATADAFAQDLERYLASEPVLAQPESAWYRARKFVSRRRWAVASVASVILALALGLSVALWQAHIARRQTQVAAAVERFLEDIFRANSSDQPDPVKARQTTARELLDIGARKIDTELAGVPDARLNILSTLGSMYSDLGLDEQAVGLQRKRVTLARVQYGNDAAEVAWALIDLGSSLHTASSANEGEAALLEAKRILDKRRDFSSRRRGNLLTMLAQHYQSSNLQRSLDYSREAVEVFRRYPTEPELPEALCAEASALSLQAQPRLAEPLVAEAVRLAIKFQGDPSPSLPRFYAYLGQTQQQLLEFASAEDSLRRAARAAQKLNGDDHVDTLETELRLGQFLFWTSRTGEGLEHIERAKEILLRTRGAADPFYAPQVFLEYGWALAAAGRLEDGLTYISKAVENRRKNRPGTRYLAQMLDYQASVLIELGRYGEANRLADEASLIAKQVGAPVSYVAADARARLLIAAGRGGEADGALDLFHPATTETGTLSLDALKLLASRAEVAWARGDHEAAARLAAELSDRLSTTSVRSYLKTLEARAALVEGRENLLLGHPAQALPLFQRAVELREATLDPLSPALADSRVALAECYLKLGDADQAKALASAATKALASHRQLGTQYTQPLESLEIRLRHTSTPAARST